MVLVLTGVTLAADIDMLIELELADVFGLERLERPTVRLLHRIHLLGVLCLVGATLLKLRERERERERVRMKSE